MRHILSAMTNRGTIRLLSLLCLFFLTISPTLAQTFYYNGAQYQVIDSEAKTCRLIDGTNLVGKTYTIIPSQAGSYTVTSIGDAFKKNEEVNWVIIPQTVTEICSYAFFRCPNLSVVEFPYNLESIGTSAFLGCHNLKQIEIASQKLNTIGISAFAECISLKEIIIHSDNPNFYCEGGMIFNKNKTKVIAVASGLSEFNIPATVHTIGNCAFSGCESLKSIKLPGGIMFIDNSAFNGCTNLVDINIPSYTREIGSSAFFNCRKLESVDIPASVTKIGAGAFGSCTSLKEINVSSENYTYISKDGFVLNKAENTIIVCPAGLTEVKIPAYIKCIGGSSFDGCENITHIDIPETVTAIGSYAFSGCTGLQSVNIPHSITTIEHNTFRGCLNLPLIRIPNSVTSIGSNAFYICDNLKYVFFDGLTNPVSSPAYTFTNSNPNLKIYVPEGALEVYNNFSKIAKVYISISEIKIEETEIKIEPEESVSLNLTLYPNENIDPEFNISYSKLGIAEISLSQGIFSIRGIKDGQTVISLSSAQPGLEPINITVTVGDYPENPFDLSGDGEVNVSDVVHLVNKLLNKETDADIHDLNNDGKVDVSDIVCLVSRILNGAGQTGTASRSGEGVAVPVCFDMSGGCTAMQTDVVVTDGATVESISINPAIARSHTLGYNEIKPGRYRVIVYSPANRTMALEAGEPLFTLAVTGNEHIATEATLFVEAEVVPTGIDGVANEALVESVSYFDLQGRRVSADATGVLIERITFTDGSVTTKKVIR